MLNRKITSGLVTALALSAITTGAFAAESPAPAAADMKFAEVGLEESAGNQEGFQALDLKTDENGDLYFELADGSKVTVNFAENAENALPGNENAAFTITPAGENHTGLKAPDLKTDENGNQYFETENGEKVFFTQTEGAADLAGDEINNTFSDSRDGVKASDLKTDENGDQYVELEDGVRVYVSQSDSAVSD